METICQQTWTLAQFEKFSSFHSWSISFFFFFLKLNQPNKLTELTAGEINSHFVLYGIIFVSL